MRSEVFDNYAKIMQEAGLIKTAEENKPASKTRSDVDDAIKYLYNLEIETNNSKDNILDQAHPDSVIIAPSYDKVNGLVENLKERQNIMIGIVNRPNTGKGTTCHKYASAYDELLKELISIGFYMDSVNNEKIMKQADSCSQQLVKKSWILPLLSWLWRSKYVISLGYSVWSILTGLRENQSNLPESIEKTLASYKRCYPHIEDQDIKRGLEEWFNKIVSLRSLYNKAIAINPQQISDTSPQQLADAVKANASENNTQVINELEKVANDIKSNFRSFIDHLDGVTSPKIEGEQDFSSIMSYLGQEAAKNTIGNEFADAVTASRDLLEDVNSLSETITSGVIKAQEQSPTIMQKIEGWIRDMF
jgi:hypothetical protein